MSEQTPGQAEQDSVVEMGEAEPSMEDILASIRKIIADDVDPVPLDGPSDVVTDMVPDMVSDAPVLETVQPSDDPFDIDALLGDLEPLEAEAPAAAAVEDAPVEALDDVMDLEIPVIPDEPALELDPIQALGATAAADMLAEPVPAKPSRVAEVAATSDDDMVGLMDELLADLDMVGDDAAEAMPAEPETVFDPAAELLEAEALAEPDGDPLDQLLDLEGLDLIEDDAPGMDAAQVPHIAESEDLDLVKSLMEDLTDEDQAETVELAPEPEAAPAQTDVLDDILNMTLEDEIDAQPLDIPEPEPVAELDTVIEPEPVAVAAPADPVPSLADIAASAEAHADAAQAPAPAVLASAAVAGAALAGGAVLAPEPEPVAPIAAEPEPPALAVDAVEPVASEPVIQSEPTPDPTPMETPMPRAVRSEAILDEVTEEATMSAFAELNQVVEEKAVYSERGPRIGDLVSEALKPMLKEWLDANLKGIVERAVAKEVKRISTGK